MINIGTVLLVLTFQFCTTLLCAVFWFATDRRLRATWNALQSQRVYVVVVYDGDKTKEIIVFIDMERAQEYWRHCNDIYGASNVCFAARGIEDVPETLFDYALNAL